MGLTLLFSCFHDGFCLFISWSRNCMWILLRYTQFYAHWSNRICSYFVCFFLILLVLKIWNCLIVDSSTAYHCCQAEGKEEEEQLETKDPSNFQSQKNKNQGLLVCIWYLISWHAYKWAELYYFTSIFMSRVKNADYSLLSITRSFKERFRLMKDGQIRRWKAGKRHNAFSKVCHIITLMKN